MRNNQTKAELEEELQRAKNEKLNHEFGSYAYSIWRREVARITALIKDKK